RNIHVKYSSKRTWFQKHKSKQKDLSVVLNAIIVFWQIEFPI
ncbi:hypothetical protein HMPREF9446_01783, partial [Bacteroides fluxus YIT 12057]